MGAGLQQVFDLPEGGQPGGGVHGFGAGGIEIAGAVFCGQVAQAHDAAEGFGTAGVQGALRPPAGRFPQRRRPRLPVGGTFPDAAVQSPHAEAAAEFAGLQPRMSTDLLHAVIEQAHHAPVPAHPHLAPDELRRGLVIGLGHFHKTVALHLAASFLITFVNRGRQRPQGLAFLLKHGGHLPPGGAMHAFVSNVLLPVPQMGVLFGQRGELPPLERVVFGVAHAAFHLALVLGRIGTAGHRCHAVVAAKIRQFRVQRRVIPIRLDHRRLEVVEIEQPGHSTERAHRVFDHPQERLRVLTQHHLAVTLARMAQHRPEQPRPPGFAASLHQRRAQPEVHLQLLPRRTFDAPDPLRLARLEPGHVARNRWIGPAETVPGDQILIDALGAQPQFQHRQNDLPERAAQAARAGDHFGWGGAL